MKVSLRLLQLDEMASVSGVKLDEGDEDFAGGSMETVFERLKGAPNPHAFHPFLVIAGKVVGFFMLREGPALPVWAKSDVISLHNFRISKHTQGRGYGAAALVLGARWIAAHRPDVSALMLSVNEENANARGFYTRYGFKDAGIAFEGRLGKELVLSCCVAELAARQLPGE
jgi:ribosomal protein S18 acetylase RimI-like enzyme